MSEHFQNKPRSIQESIRSGNTKHLRNAARKSARTRKENSEIKKDMEALTKARKQEAEAQILADAIKAEEQLIEDGILKQDSKTD